jgi:Protein of unknown function, DUF488
VQRTTELDFQQCLPCFNRFLHEAIIHFPNPFLSAIECDAEFRRPAQPEKALTPGVGGASDQAPPRVPTLDRLSALDLALSNPYLLVEFYPMSQEAKYVKKILCPADSRKMSGHCVAGREIVRNGIGDWIRPVSSREHEEISVEERRYEDGHLPNLLDIISIPMLEPKPRTYQSENHLIAHDYYWHKTGKATWQQVEAALDVVNGPLWVNGHQSYSMINNRVPEAQANKFKNSLLLIRPIDLKISVGPQGGQFAPNRRRVRAIFNFNGAPYKLNLTDAVKESEYLLGNNGTFPVPNAILCVSLGEPYMGDAYKLAAALVTPDRLEATMADEILTIGHSTHPMERFLGLLKAAGITAVTDVRSRPYSRLNPQFNRESLKKALGAAGIKYVFLGKELGARSEDPNCYRNGQVQYDILSGTELFRQGIERVLAGAKRYRIALMCAEKEPLDCHRTILVARRLVEQGVQVSHILADGSVETHEHAIERLVTMLNLPREDMFRSRETAVTEAYAQQSDHIAYRDETNESSSADCTDLNAASGII